MAITKAAVSQWPLVQEGADCIGKKVSACDKSTF